MRPSSPEQAIARESAGIAANYVSVKNVSKVFRSSRGDFKALHDINLNIRSGEFLSIVGPSGCGKSTLLRCIAGLEKVSGGTVTILGQPVTEPPENLGMVFQRDVLLDWRTVMNNVLLPIEFRGKKVKDYKARADQLLKVFGIDGFQNRYPWELSGGMRQRVAISRALLSDPALLLMDEPFGALDALTRDDLNVELQRISGQDQKTVLFVTHSIPEAVFLSDRVVVMRRAPGEIVDILDIDLPRPRRLAVRETKEFNAYAKVIREIFEKLGIYGARS